MTAGQKIEAAGARLVLSHPWWAALYLRLAVRPATDPACDTMWTNGTSIEYFPPFVESLSTTEVMGVLLHEVAHCALLHCFRRGGRDHHRWNVACDHAVNRLLAEGGIALPSGVLPGWDTDATAEEIYAALPPSTPRVAQDVRDGDDGGDGPKKMGEADWREAVAAAPGDPPGTQRRMIEAALATPRDWRRDLAIFSSSVRGDEFGRTWDRPSRRAPGLPGRRRLPIPHLALVVDTSGSISAEILSAMMAEMRSICASGVQCTLMAADAAVLAEIEPGQAWPSALPGGGGTDFRPALRRAEQIGVDGVVYLTDANGEFGPPASIPVLWCTTTGVVPPWGETTRIL